MRYDLIVIGSGPAGQKAALQAAKVGKRVAIVEKHGDCGGACLSVGTIPSKSFRESVYRFSLGSKGLIGQEMDKDLAKLKPVQAKDLPDMKRLLRRRDRVFAGESQVIENQLKRNKVEVIRGGAELTGPHSVRVGKRALEGEFIFIAVGANPVSPPHLRVDGQAVFDSNSILTLKKMPRSMIVLGAGVIGCEYASMFQMAGTQVTLVDKRAEVLANVDREISKTLVERLSHFGMKFVLGIESEQLKRVRGGVELALASGKKLKAEVALVALGRQGNTAGLGLESVGLKPDARGLIQVDKHFRTDVPSIYAIGDVVGPPSLASTGFEQGRVAACHAFSVIGLTSHEMPEYFPYGIYTIPEISTIGATEEQLQERRVPYLVGKARYRELARGQIVGDRWGLLKLLVAADTRKLLGVHIIGDNAADLIHIGQAVMTLGGTSDYFVQSIFNYPTLAEAYKTAAYGVVNAK